MLFRSLLESLFVYMLTQDSQIACAMYPMAKSKNIGLNKLSVESDARYIGKHGLGKR